MFDAKLKNRILGYLCGGKGGRVPFQDVEDVAHDASYGPSILFTRIRP